MIRLAKEDLLNQGFSKISYPYFPYHEAFEDLYCKHIGLRKDNCFFSLSGLCWYLENLKGGWAETTYYEISFQQDGVYIKAKPVDRKGFHDESFKVYSGGNS